MSPPLPQDGSQKSRDATVALLLGTFFVVLAIPVAVGAVTATLAIDRALSGAAAGILALVGTGFLWAGRRRRR